MTIDDNSISRDYFVQQGRRGGKKRAARLTKEERSAIAKKAAKARWAAKQKSGR